MYRSFILEEARHPVWNFIKKLIIDVVIIILLIIVAGFLLLSIPVTEYHYEYIDLDNNKGTAKECSYKFEGYKKGGQGSPVCILDDGTVLMVKSYKYIEDRTYTPLKED